MAVLLLAAVLAYLWTQRGPVVKDDARRWREAAPRIGQIVKDGIQARIDDALSPAASPSPAQSDEVRQAIEATDKWFRETSDEEKQDYRRKKQAAGLAPADDAPRGPVSEEEAQRAEELHRRAARN